MGNVVGATYQLVACIGHLHRTYLYLQGYGCEAQLPVVLFLGHNTAESVADVLPDRTDSISHCRRIPKFCAAR